VPEALKVHRHRADTCFVLFSGAATRARHEFGATRLQSWAVAGYVYMFRFAIAGSVWAALVWAATGDLRNHPLLAFIVGYPAFLFALGTFPICFVAVFLGRRGEQRILWGISIVYLVVAIRIAFTRRGRKEARPDQT
jgi:hypothetical protein